MGIRDSPYDSDTRFNVSVVTKNREIVVVGSTAIFRFDGDGNVVWQQKTPYFSSSHVYQQIIETSDGGLLLCGPSFSNGVVAKLHSTGILDWARHFALDAYLNCRSMIETPSGYYFTGYSYSGFDPYQQNGFSQDQ